MEFNYHNISIEDTCTIPGQKLLTEDNRASLVVDILSKYKGSSKKLMDLGSLEGGYSVIASSLGFDVYSIEGRFDNCKKIQWLKRATNTDFKIVCIDVKNIGLANLNSDVTLCLGLLYHLNNPVDFLTEIANKTNDLLILSTHYSQKVDPAYDRFPRLRRVKKAIYKRFPTLFTKPNYGLGKLEMNEALEGRWYREYNKNSSDENIEKLPASSLSNNRSFWLTKESLIKLLKSLNFEVEIRDELIEHDSALFICKKIK